MNKHKQKDIQKFMFKRQNYLEFSFVWIEHYYIITL